MIDKLIDLQQNKIRYSEIIVFAITGRIVPPREVKFDLFREKFDAITGDNH